jgi:hypothetical protein
MNPHQECSKDFLFQCLQSITIASSPKTELTNEEVEPLLNRNGGDNSQVMHVFRVRFRV